MQIDEKNMVDAVKLMSKVVSKTNLTWTTCYNIHAKDKITCKNKIFNIKKLF